MLMVLPIAFIPFIIHFKAGLVLYWMTTNLWTVGQGLITRRLVPKQGAPAPKRSSRTSPRDTGDGAKEAAQEPKPAPASSGQPRRVKKRKKARPRR
jgi:YidC/Oxa1 family membrane protein insertase